MLRFVNIIRVIFVVIFCLISNIIYAASPLDTLKNITESAKGLLFKDNIPKTVAVLPFTGEGSEEDKKELRITFNNHISSKKFENIKLDEIDEKLAILEKETGKKWSEFDPVTLSKRLGVDGLFYMEVLGIEKIYAGVYGSLSIKVKGKLVSGDKGEVVWEKEESVAERSGGVPLSPWGAISTAVSSALVLRESVKISLMDKLFREMAKGIPEPKVGAVRKPPVIFSVITNAQDSPFKLGAEILVSVKGQAGSMASFNIPKISENIPLMEIEPGNYVGKYIVKEGDNAKSVQIKVVLFDPKTKLENVYTVPYPIEIDSIPPEEIKNLKVVGLKDKVHLQWDRVEDAKDYFVQRSETGEFIDIFITQVPEGYDETAEVGKTYYYRVFVRDKAGNISKPVDVKFYYVKRGPTELPDKITENMVLYAAGSPYLINKDSYINNGVEVVAEPGVVIEFTGEYKLEVNGKIKLNGSREQPVTIKGKNYSITVKDAGDDSFLGQYLLIENATSVVISNSTAKLSNSLMNNLKDGLVVDRNGILNITNIEIGSSEKGLILLSGKILGNVVFRNNNIAFIYNDGDVTNVKFSFDENKKYIESKKELTIKTVTITSKVEKQVEQFLSGVDKSVFILDISPLNLSSKNLREDLFERIKIAIANAVMKGSISEIADNLKKLESLIDFNQISGAEFLAYVYNLIGDAEKSKIFYDKTDLKYKEIFNDVIKKEKSSQFIFKIAEMKYTSLQKTDNIEQILAKRVETKGLREVIDEIVPNIDRTKILEIDKKIFAQSSKYVPVVAPFARYSSELSSSVYFLYAIDSKQLKDDLISVGIIGSDKKETKIGLVSCNINFITDEVRNIIRKHKFEFVDIKAEVCDLPFYYSKAKEQLIDLIILLKTDSKQMPSKLGSNLNLFTSNIEIKLGNVFLEKDYTVLLEGGSGYHINESEGVVSALKDAFEKIKDKLERNILAFERDMGLDEKRVKAKAEYLSIKTAAQVILTVTKEYPIFANQYKNYADNNPVIELSIKNNTQKQLRNLKYSIFVKGLMDFPTEGMVELIEPQKIENIKLKAVFNNKLLHLTENSKFQATLKASYVEDGKEKDFTSVATLNVYEKNALVWDDKKKLATFITPRDPNILDLSREIINNIPKKIISANISFGVSVFEFMKTYGIKYLQDPNSPYSSASGNINIIDYVQYPTDTLKRKTGDCDDLVAFISSLLEALGVKTAFVDIPGHIFVMFDTGILPEEIENYGLKRSDFIEYENRLYIPLETTFIRSSFYDAWKQGLNLYNKHYNKDLTITTTEKGWESYKPPTFDFEKINIIFPYNFVSSYSSSIAELQKVRDNEILNYIKDNKIKPENALYRLYKYALFDDALHLSKVMEKSGRVNPAFYNDTGNIYYVKHDYKNAVNYYKKAFELSGNFVYIQNLLKAYEKLNDKDNYNIWEKKLLELKSKI